MEGELVEAINRLKTYREHLIQILQKKNYEDNESSLFAPFDEQTFELVKIQANKNKNDDLRYVIVIGIGGSNLGTKAIYDAILGAYDQLESNRFPKLIFVDTNAGEYLEKLIKFLQKEVTKPEQIVINLISKSGTTTESIVNFEILFKALSAHISNLTTRIVITTDENSKLWKKAEEKNIAKLPIPQKVGGRYSVLSAVGLYPLLLIGLPIEKLLQGAQEMALKCLNEEQNPAIISAIILYLQSKQGKVINDNFIFNPELESLGKWYRQLMGESIGKEQDLDGKSVFAGITPTVSIGSTDLHSVGQLYLGGPRDKLTTFIRIRPQQEQLMVDDEPFLTGLVDSISQKTPQDIMNAIYEGVKIAYEKQQLPYTEVELEEKSLQSLGEFLQFKMLEMMYLGKLLNIQTFDQPHVELYKVETRKILNK